MQVFRGIPVSHGIAIGRAFVLDDVRQHIPRRTVSNTTTELARLDSALDASREDLARMRQQAEVELGTEAAKIFAFHQGMLADPSLTSPIRARIEEQRVTAEYAVQEQFRIIADRFGGMADSAFRTKVDDVWDLHHRILRHLIGEHDSQLDGLEGDVIVLAPDLTPSQTASFRSRSVLGFGTDMGGRTSHTAIFARALGIPAIVGLERICEIADDGDHLIIDGGRGVVIIDPDEETLEEYRRQAASAAAYALTLTELADLEPVTLDGVRIRILGNIEFPSEIEQIQRHGGDGVGLFRTEFLWLTSDHEPTEEEQYVYYRQCIELLGGKTLIVRTFDLGADKYTQERAMNPERNPFLGCRSIRYCLQNLGMFKRQLRAILRASAHGPLKVMFPLVTNTLELRQARMIFNDVMEDLEEEGHAFDRHIPIGMMVEVPSAAVMAATFAKEVDFFSIGTNDLIQYTLAVDRTNERVASLYSSSHPAVIKLIKEVVRAGRRHNVDVSCCGEVASDTDATMLLLGLGLRSLSVTPASIPYLKRVIRSTDIETCERLARTVGSFDSERQVAAYLRDQFKKHFPDGIGGRSAE